MTDWTRSPERRVCGALPTAMALMLIAGTAQGGALDVPHGFSAGQPAVAAEVNANFDAVETAVNDNDARIAQLEAMVATLQAQLAALQASNVMAIDPYVEVTDIEDPNDGTLYPTVRITGANLQVVNGEGDAVQTANGLGNLIVGYDVRDEFGARCSRSNWSNEQACVVNGGVWAVNHRNGSHNLVVGRANSYSWMGGLVAGQSNLVSGTFASVTGGNRNTASGVYASVGGGQRNAAVFVGTSVSGGESNIAFGTGAAVSGGRENLAVGTESVVGGGYRNRADGRWATVSGGEAREADTDSSWAAGSLLEDN